MDQADAPIIRATQKAFAGLMFLQKPISLAVKAYRFFKTPSTDEDK